MNTSVGTSVGGAERAQMLMQVYLDHAATTPLDAVVLEAMMPHLTTSYGNASSVHALGRKARFAVEDSRERVAACLGAEPSEIVFTSGGTEADNLAIKGGVSALQKGVLTSATEHEAILKTIEAVHQWGYETHIVTPAHAGAVSLAQLNAALQSRSVGLVSLMHANNEVGTLTRIPEIAQFCHAHGILLHTDAVQTAGTFDLNVEALGVDLMSLSGHKIYGPKGVGVLYVRGGVDLKAIAHGGSQERKRRAGTENVAAIIGFAAALEQAVQHREERTAHLKVLRHHLVEGLQATLGEAIRINTPLDEGESVPHILNIVFPPKPGESAMDGEMLLLNLDMEGIYASSGSACTSGAIEPSHVLLAMGYNVSTAATAVRLSLGKGNTVEEIDYTIDTLAKIYRRMQLLK